MIFASSARRQPEKTIARAPSALYLAVEQKDLAQVKATDWTKLHATDPRLMRFTSRRSHARCMARDWFAQSDNPRMGYVLQFKVQPEFVKSMVLREVGRDSIREFWLQTGQLQAFNAALRAPIEKAFGVRGSRPAKAVAEGAPA